ncbi:hypothetical protein AAER27_17345, partial [Pseudomonas aeruginosa]
LPTPVETGSVSTAATAAATPLKQRQQVVEAETTTVAPLRPVQALPGRMSIGAPVAPADLAAAPAKPVLQSGPKLVT